MLYYTFKTKVYLYVPCIMSFFVEMTNVPNNADSVAKYFRTLTIVHQFSNNK